MLSSTRGQNREETQAQEQKGGRDQPRRTQGDHRRLTCIDGHFISGYGDAEDIPTKPLELDLKAAKTAERYLDDKRNTLDRFEQVGRLIHGFESPYALELLATVHWLAVQEQIVKEGLVGKVYSWNKRKRMFPEEHILSTWGALEERGWLDREAVRGR